MPTTKKVTTKKYYKKPMVKKPKMTLEKKIKAISLKEQETKIKSFSIFSDSAILNVGLNNSGTNGLLVKNILGATTFSMAQGSNQQQRIGNTINNCKLNLKGFIHSMPAHSTSNVSLYPYEVHVLVYKTKQGSSGDPDKILQNTNNTNTDINGLAVTTLLPFNRKGYTIKRHRVFRLKSNPATAVSTLSNAIGVENPQWNGGDASFFRRFSIDVPIKNDLTFDDSGTAPINEWCSVGAYIINGDGAVIGSSFQQTRAKITIAATLKYKDS